MLRVLVGGLLLALAFAGGYAISTSKTVTLTVDGTVMRVTTMKSRVIDIVQENGFAVGERDDLYPAAEVLRCITPTASCCGAAGRCRFRWMARDPGRSGQRHPPSTRRWPSSR